ncbi:MAG: hypothetical protein RXR39_02850 [Caldivirga sp.]
MKINTQVTKKTEIALLHTLIEYWLPFPIKPTTKCVDCCLRGFVN